MSRTGRILDGPDRLKCKCLCEYGFAGLDCGTPVYKCITPEVDNVGNPPCEEGYGLYITGQYCTTRC